MPNLVSSGKRIFINIHPEIRMVAGFAEVAEEKEILVAGPATYRTRSSFLFGLNCFGPLPSPSLPPQSPPPKLSASEALDAWPTTSSLLQSGR